MSDENQNGDGDVNGGGDEQDLKAKRRRLQYDLIILDSDLKKMVAKKEQGLAEIKRLKRQADLLKVQIEDKEREQKKMDSEEALVRNDFLALKKKINVLN
jgi:hypothetical protein